MAKCAFEIYFLPRTFQMQMHADNGSTMSTCFLSSDAPFVVAAEEAVTRPPFWRANFAILKCVTLGNVITVEHGRMGLSSSGLLVSCHVTSRFDA